MTTSTFAPAQSTSAPNTALISTILTAYRAALANLATLSGDTFIRARNALLWGSLHGSKIYGVRNQKGVEDLLSACIVNGRKLGAIQEYRDGRQVYVFDLPPRYLGKGFTTYVRIGDLRDEGRESLAGAGFADKYDPDRDITTTTLHAPNIKERPCAIVTVVLSKDGSTFLEWYCGEPHKSWTPETLSRLLLPNGELNFDDVWVELGVNHFALSEQEKRRADRARQLNRKRNYARNQTRGHAPINTLAAAMEVAVVNANNKDETPVEQHPVEQPTIAQPVAELAVAEL